MADEKFAKNKSFSSFVEFEKELFLHQTEERQLYTKKNSKLYTPEDDLIYYEIKYTCIFGGIFQPSGKNIRQTRYHP